MKIEVKGQIPADIYVAAIAADDSVSRKCREERALQALLDEIFGEGCERGHEADCSPVVLRNGRKIGQDISVSHSMHYAAIAVAHAGYEVGIDIEERREQLARVCGRVLSPEEQAVYGARPDGLLEAWTIKEALYKAWRRHAEREIDFAKELHLPSEGGKMARTSLHDGRPGGEYGVYSSGTDFGAEYALVTVVYRPKRFST